jgi:hypothetical protein
MSLWVTDSSPLIFLAKLNRLDLLRQEAQEVLAPPAVLGEIAAQDDEAKRQISAPRSIGSRVEDSVPYQRNGKLAGAQPRRGDRIEPGGVSPRIGSNTNPQAPRGRQETGSPRSAAGLSGLGSGLRASFPEAYAARLSIKS